MNPEAIQRMVRKAFWTGACLGLVINTGVWLVVGRGC